MAEFRSSGFRVVCNYARLAEFLRRNVVDEAVIYLPFGSFYHHWSEVAGLCAHHGIIVRLNSDTFGLNNARWLAEEVGDGHYIATHTGVGEGWPLAVKRTLDIAISSVLLLLLAPLLVGVAIAIKLTSPGPVLFLQQRVGLNKRRFKICKFRTMVPNAEELMPSLESRNEVSGPVFKIRNDPRITSIGRFLRRSSIDELPQLFNVLKGDMSLVGPRPLPVRDYEGEGRLHMSHYRNDSSTMQELTISGLLVVLKRRRSFIILTTLFCVSIAVLLCIFMTRKYKATGEIQVAKQSSDDLGLDGMKGDGGSVSDALEDNIALQTQANILQSDTLALKVIQNLGLENTWDFQPRFNPVGWVLGLISPRGPRIPHTQAWKILPCVARGC
jgi:lipopolysaccharide/colanic/teichoic acid biosynthesis glycosyltransferase